MSIIKLICTGWNIDDVSPKCMYRVIVTQSINLHVYNDIDGVYEKYTGSINHLVVNFDRQTTIRLVYKFLPFSSKQLRIYFWNKLVKK